jgi:CDGSH-type Zn-finger protein
VTAPDAASVAPEAPPVASPTEVGEGGAGTCADAGICGAAGVAYESGSLASVGDEAIVDGEVIVDDVVNGTAAPHDEPVTITAYPNGPLLVRGPFQILTPGGEVIPPRRKTVALCRCGMSTLKPFCDGSHKAVGFRTEAEPPAPQPPLPSA